MPSGFKQTWGGGFVRLGYLGPVDARVLIGLRAQGFRVQGSGCCSGAKKTFGESFPDLFETFDKRCSVRLGGQDHARLWEGVE